MKHLFYLTIAISIVLSACKKSEPEKINLVLDTETVEVKEAKIQLVKVQKSDGAVTVSSSNETVAKATIKETVITITGVSEGQANIIVKDNSNTKTISVTVLKNSDNPPTPPTEEFSVTPIQTQYLAIGDVFFYDIKGSGSYLIEVVTPSVATFELTPDKKQIKATAISEGLTSCKIIDQIATQQSSEGKEVAEIIAVQVIANAELTLSQTSIALQEGETSDRISVLYHSQTPNYEISSSNENVAIANITGNDITIKGLAGGSAVITVTDNGFNPAQSKTIDVNVIDENSEFEVNPNGVLISIGNSTGDIVLPDAAKRVPGHNAGYESPFYKKTGITSVDFNNVEFIGTWAFYQCADLETIHLRKVNVIINSFYKCTKLKNVYCYMEDPTTVSFHNSDKAFTMIAPDAVLHVPAGKTAAYQATEFGNYFSTIVEM
ncbi:MAG: hypothetical protein CSA89_01445 [Bacteroidales bacterium]|nr:MAG: hypothetical protein CSA89_01445 [Bacteroidales bacterium]